MTPKQSISVVDELGKLLYEAEGDLLRASLEKLYNLLMELEVESKTGAAKNQRSESRTNYRNGTRSRPLDVQLTLMSHKFKVSTVKGRVEICGANTTRP